MLIVVTEGDKPRKTAPKSVDEHVALVQSLFMEVGAFDVLKSLWKKGDRVGFAKKC